MRIRSVTAVATILAGTALSAVPSVRGQTPTDTAAAHRAGTLLLIGGGLDNDAKPVFERLLELAGAHGPARIVIATAASGEQDTELTDKTEALRAFAPDVAIDAIRRETPADATVAAIDAATALLFTGGDQQRVTARYRPDDRATPEWSAMQRLLARGGVIAGCSAGDAMMGELMLLGGRSREALGSAPAAAADGEQAVAGPRVGPGMHFLPWAITDSHFFERDRLGRLVAALEASGRRFGIGVGEDAGVEVDLERGVVTGLTAAESLLVDLAHLQRSGLARRNVVARLIGQGESVALPARLAAAPPAPTARPAGPPRVVPVVEPGQNRQLASWRLFRHARVRGQRAVQLAFDGWRVTAWPAADGETVCDLEVLAPVQVFVLAGQSNMEGYGAIDERDAAGNQRPGTLTRLAHDPATVSRFRHLLAEQHAANPADAPQWRVRDDVFVRFLDRQGPLTTGFGANPQLFGIELQFGQVLGDALDAPVVIVKTAWGGRSLHVDFRPPGAGGEIGAHYRHLLDAVAGALAELPQLAPDLAGRGHRLAGLVWWHGWNDGCDPEHAVPAYEQNLVHLIRDLRRDLHAPDLPVVVAELTGPWVDPVEPQWIGVRKAQAAAAARAEFAGNVAFVRTRDFVRAEQASPGGWACHEWNNAETYVLVGDACGKAIKTLLGLDAK